MHKSAKSNKSPPFIATEQLKITHGEGSLRMSIFLKLESRDNIWVDEYSILYMNFEGLIRMAR
jgi:hypothetical protein